MALKHPDRNYPFEFPINVPGFFMGTVRDKLTTPSPYRPNGFWPSLPFNLVTKINEALTGRHGMTITVTDLDEISDKDWDAAMRVLKP